MLYINGIIKTYNKIENKFCHRGKWVYCDPFMDKILELVTSNKEYKFKSYKKMLEYLNGSTLMPLSDNVKVFYEYKGILASTTIEMTGNYASDFRQATTNIEEIYECALPKDIFSSLVWHHREGVDNDIYCTMELITKSSHSTKHYGGVYEYIKRYGEGYGIYNK